MPQFDKDKLKSLVGELPSINDIIDQLELDINTEFIPLSGCDTPSVETDDTELPCETPLTPEQKQELVDSLPKVEVPTFEAFPMSCANDCIQNLIKSTKIASDKVFDNINNYSQNVVAALTDFYREYMLFKYNLNTYYYYSMIYDSNLLSNIKLVELQNYMGTANYDSNTIIASVFRNLYANFDSYKKSQIDKVYYSTLIGTEFASKTFATDVELAINTVYSNLDNSYRIKGGNGVYELNFIVGNQSSGSANEFNNVFRRKPTDDELKNIDSYFLNVDIQANLLSDSIMATGFQSLIYYKSVFILHNSGQISNFSKNFEKSKTELLSSLSYLVDTVSKKDIKKNKQIIIDSIQITCCGKPIVVDETPVKDSSDDLNNNSFQKPGNPELTDLKYWQKYASQLTLVNLLPIYWTVGVIIGPVKIPMPTVWTAIYCFHTPFNIVVIFLTINGLVVCPVIWVLNMKPIADNQSMLLVLFRGGMQQIKTGTNCEALNQTIVGDVDIAPDISTKSPFKTDDLPTYERLTIANLPYVAYLDKWLKSAKPFMGLP